MAQAIFGFAILVGALFVVCKGLSLIGKYCRLSDITNVLGETFTLTSGTLPDGQDR
ncbi:MAG: hypothetical protein H6636_05955 [Anaerolineales bacterium]|nr:hypothetical protein [Anaerolineales bacterium]